MKVKLSEIVVDDGIYPRGSVSGFNVQRLIAAAKTGAKFPPLTVEAGTMRLVDGRHRYGAYKEMEVEKVEVIAKTYTSEADLFADSVRLNVGHGLPLDQYSISGAIIRLRQYGLTKDAIADVVRLPVDKIEKIERGLAVSAATNQPIAVKGGLSHLRGHALTPQQIEVNRRYGGQKAVFYIRQTIGLLQNDMYPHTPGFAAAMDELMSIWLGIRPDVVRRGTATPGLIGREGAKLD